MWICLIFDILVTFNQSSCDGSAINVLWGFNASVVIIDRFITTFLIKRFIKYQLYYDMLTVSMLWAPNWYNGDLAHINFIQQRLPKYFEARVNATLTVYVIVLKETYVCFTRIDIYKKLITIILWLECFLNPLWSTAGHADVNKVWYCMVCNM